MTLIDTGPLVAFLLSTDPNHSRCIDAIGQESLPLTTSISCFTEAMYLLGKAGGSKGQNALWSLVEVAVIKIADLLDEDLMRCRKAMGKYEDVPCDFADASLLALAKRLGARRVITLDGHFCAYQVSGRSLEVAPGPRSPV